MTSSQYEPTLLQFNLFVFKANTELKRMLCLTIKPIKQIKVHHETNKLMYLIFFYLVPELITKKNGG